MAKSLASMLLRPMMWGLPDFKRRGRQTELLWLLAIAAENNEQLGEVVTDYADEIDSGVNSRLRSVGMELSRGSRLSDVLQHFPELLPAEAALMARTGESCGELPSALKTAARAASRRQQDREPLLSWILTYGMGVITAMTLILGFLMYYIVPKFKRIFQDFGTELPGVTVGLIEVSDVVVSYWYLIVFMFPPLYLFLAFAPAMAATSLGRSVIRGIWPLWRWRQRRQTPGILRALQVTVDAKLPLVEGCRLVAKSHDDASIREDLTGAVAYLQQGSICWPELQRDGFLTSREAAFLAAAEKARNLSWALDVTASEIERRNAFRIEVFVTALRPVLLAGLAMLVAWVAISMFLPLVKLLNDLS